MRTTMSRPKPTVLLESTDKKTYRTEQVLEAEGIWAVYYKEKPFNLKSFCSITHSPGPKYKKTSFSNPGHAYSLCKRLNDLYDCIDFKVVLLSHGDIQQNHTD